MTSSLRLMLALLSGAVIGAALFVVAVNAEDENSSSFQAHMHGHLDQVGAVKAAVIAGDLAAVREPAFWLAEHEEPGVPEPWIPYVDEMRRYAERAATSQDLTAAAAAVSEIARACGDCHLASGFSVAFGYDQRPPGDVQNLRTEMQRHLWAADRMWDGLIGPSDRAWKAGTDMLAEVQLTAPQVTSEESKQQQAVDLVSRIQALGRQGSLASSRELRSGLYGEFLALCASCHSLTGGGPGS